MKTLNLSLYQIAGYLSEQVWGRFSSAFQLGASAFLAKFYNTKLSRHFIKPYCLWQYGDMNHYRNFLPGRGKKSFETFQDFFTREFNELPTIASETVWPCEGYLCETGKMSEIELVKVKGQKRHVRSIFGQAGPQIPNDYYFSNVFLHNNNYHHIHSPVNGTVTRIEHIPGDLLLLRPWAYKNYPSLPAITNERINVDVTDEQGRIWYLSIVGGPLVATIKMAKSIGVGSRVGIAEKLATFEMGSTCCMASPVSPQAIVGDMVDMGAPL